MKKNMILLSVMLLNMPLAYAGDFVFSCRDEWHREMDVPVTADSVDAAREILKTDPKYTADYSQCVYQRTTQVKHIKPHHIITPQEETPSTTPEPGVPMD